MASGYERSCLPKRRFADEVTVRAAAQIECDRGAAPRNAMWIYPCGNCRGWHLTNKPGKRMRRVTSAEMYEAPDPHIDDGIRTPQFGGYWGGYL